MLGSDGSLSFELAWKSTEPAFFHKKKAEYTLNTTLHLDQVKLFKNLRAFQVTTFLMRFFYLCVTNLRFIV